MRVLIISPNLVNCVGHYYHFAIELKRAFKKLGCEVDFLLPQDSQLSITEKKLIPSYPFFKFNNISAMKKLFLHVIYIIKVSSLLKKIQKDYDFMVIDSSAHLWDIVFSVGLAKCQKPIFLYLHSAECFSSQRYKMIKKVLCQVFLKNSFIYFLTYLPIEWNEFAKKIDIFESQFISNVAFPLIKPPIIRNQEKEGIFYISYLGRARKAKNFPIVVNLVSNYVNDRCGFIIQCNPSISGKYETEIHEGVLELNSLKKKHLIVLNHSLSSEEYFYYLNKSSVLLLIYEPETYKYRFSGILLEAWVCGKPVIVTDGTWLSEQVGKYGGGIIVKQTRLSDLAKAIETIKADYQTFRNQANRAGELMYEKNNSVKLAELILKKARTHINN